MALTKLIHELAWLLSSLALNKNATVVSIRINGERNILHAHTFAVEHLTGPAITAQMARGGSNASYPYPRSASLKGTDVEPQAQGQLIADPNSNSAVLIIIGLTPLERGKTYQIRLIQGDAPESAGLLTVHANGQGVLVVTSEAIIGSFDRYIGYFG